jgi:hypothetical protein
MPAHGTGPSFPDQVFAPRRKKPARLKHEPGLVFVIMAFRGMDKVYAAIKDECTKLSLNATRVDEHIGFGFIIRDIYRLIKSAEFIVCDLTHERPNVYYELGFAHGVGNGPDNILLLAKDGTASHFDIAPLRIQYYRSQPHLRSIVYRDLQTMMQVTRQTSSKHQEPLPSSKA